MRKDDEQKEDIKFLYFESKCSNFSKLQLTNNPVETFYYF